MYVVEYQVFQRITFKFREVFKKVCGYQKYTKIIPIYTSNILKLSNVNMSNIKFRKNYIFKSMKILRCNLVCIS